jgi:hypothetical protein
MGITKRRPQNGTHTWDPIQGTPKGDTLQWTKTVDPLRGPLQLIPKGNNPQWTTDKDENNGYLCMGIPTGDPSGDSVQGTTYKGPPQGTTHRGAQKGDTPQGTTHSGHSIWDPYRGPPEGYNQQTTNMGTTHGTQYRGPPKWDTLQGTHTENPLSRPLQRSHKRNNPHGSTGKDEHKGHP